MAPPTQPTALQAALREARRGLAVVAALSLFLNLLVLVSPLYMFQVFDRVLPSGHVETLVALTVVAGFALLVFGLLEVIRHQALVRISTWLDRRLSEPVLAASLGEALAGRAIGAQPLRDLAQLRGFISSENVFPILDAPWTLAFIAVIWLLHPWLGVLALLGAAFLFALALGSEVVMRTPLGEANERWMAAQRRSETGGGEAEGVHARGRMAAGGRPGAPAAGGAPPGWGCTPGACGGGCCGGATPTTIAPSISMRRRATVVPPSWAWPSSCACSSRSACSGSAPTWCWAASLPPAA